MPSEKNIFVKESEKVAFDLKHRNTIKFNISKYDAAVERGLERYSNLELARERASYIKAKAVDHLPEYLLEFEKNISEGRKFTRDDLGF